MPNDAQWENGIRISDSWPTVPGPILRIVGAPPVTTFMKSLLFGVSPIDPFTFLATAILITYVALLASFLPARSAMRVNPMIALRCE